MTTHELADRSFGVTVDRRGRATVTGAGITPVTVERVTEEYDVAIYVSPQWPAIYVYTEAEAEAYVTRLGEGAYELRERLVPVRWMLPGEPSLNFVDLSDVMLYAVRVSERG